MGVFTEGPDDGLTRHDQRCCFRATRIKRERDVPKGLLVCCGLAKRSNF